MSPYDKNKEDKYVENKYPDAILDKTSFRSAGISA